MPEPPTPASLAAPVAPATPPPSRVRWLYPLVIVLVHLALVAYACPRKVFFGGEPLVGLDFQTHYEQTTTVCEALRRYGKIWAYDPDLLAGQPAGLIFDVDTRAHTLWTCGLTRLGVSQPVAYNLFAILVHLLAPLCLWLAARLLRTGFRAETVTLAFAVLLWHFDSGARWLWWVGMVSFATTAFVSPLIVALFYRLLQGEPRGVEGVGEGAQPREGANGRSSAREGKLRFLLPLYVALTLALLTHVWAFATLVVPLTALYIRGWRRIGRAGHLRVWSVAVVAILGNLFWLVPVVRHLDLISFSGQVGQANPLYVIADYLDVFLNPLHTGSVATRTVFRLAAFCGAALALWRWRKDKDDRFFLGGVSWLWPLGMAYFASLLPLFKETEPYRFIAPAIFFAAVLAGPWFASILTRAWIRELGKTARVVLVVLLLLLLPRVVQTITYFIPEVLPAIGGPSILKPNIAGPKAVMPTPEFFSFRHDGIPEDYRQIVAWLRDEAKEEGRVLVEWWVLAEYLRWASDRPIIGGFPDRRIKHEACNLFRYRADERYHGRALAEYLVRYNIRYLIVSNPYVLIEQRRDLLEPQRWIGYHRIYRVRHFGDYFARGSGKVRTRVNQIEISDARPEPRANDLLIRFHYHPTLRCRAMAGADRCRLARSPLPDNPVGFISVSGDPRLPRHFVIENTYER